MRKTNSNKRRAEDQLSPYSEDPIDPQPSAPASGDEKTPTTTFKKARARRNKAPDVKNKEALKGIFGKVSLSEIKGESKKNEKNDLLAGVNKSFLKAVTRVLDKQANKDLTYLFKQYKSFIEEIERNKKQL